MILFEIEALSGDGVDLRLGYVIAESSWGKGIATELVAGLVEWAVASTGIVSISGGVAPGNLASARVLGKAGFSPVEHDGDSPEEQIYRIEVGPRRNG